MKQSQREIQSIQAELKSIRADTTSAGSVSLLEPVRNPEVNSFLDVEGSPNERIPYEALFDELLLDESSLYELSSTELGQAAGDSIAPTIVRQNQANHLAAQSTKKREVECFPIFSQASPQTQAQLETVVEQLRHHASTTSAATKHSGQRSSSSNQQTSRQASQQTRQPTIPPKGIAIQQLLEEKAQQINALSSQQEAVILELMEISGQLGRNNEATDPNFKLSHEFALECEVAEIPYVERDSNGMLILTNRTIDQPPARKQQTTAKATKISRQRTQKSNRDSIHLIKQIGYGIWQPIMWIGAASINVVGFIVGNTQSTPRRKGYRGSGRRAASTAEMPVTLKEATVLVIGSALLRLSLDWVVLSYPMLWVPSILVMITPAAFAIYRATVKPPTGFAWGYRLFAILIGLLIGGRL